MLRPLYEWDRVIVLEYLERNDEEAAFIIGNLFRFGITNRSNILRCGDYYGYFEGNSLKGIIAFYNMGNCVPHFESFGAVPQFSELMKMKRFSMLLGMDKIIRPLFEAVRNYRYLKEFEECNYFTNKNFTPFKLEGIQFLDVSDTTDANIVNFVRKAFRQGFGAERTLEDTRLMLKQRYEGEDFLVLLKDEKPLAQACIQASSKKTDQIGAVYTLEEERGKGYAKAIVSELCERIIGRGKLPTLVVNKQNFPAINAYKALGFEYCGDYLLIKFII